jgi:N6-adenosine-specific RNA methylase IME4
MTRNGRYAIVYADPPWDYPESGTGTRVIASKYPLLPIEHIRSLPVSEIVEDDAYLFLWVTFPRLADGLTVFEPWGFRYKTVAFTWIKTNKRQCLDQTSFIPSDPDLFQGMGSYTRSNAEVCLLGIRGNPRPVSHSVHSVIIATIGRHSAKPAETRKRIIELCGDLPRIELFARNTPEGWHVWGNEIPDHVAVNPFVPNNGIKLTAAPELLVAAEVDLAQPQLMPDR